MRFALPLLAAALLAAPAVAAGCEMTTSPADSCSYRLAAGLVTPFIECRQDLADLLGIAFYFNNDNCQDGCIFSIWVYQETNGIAWQQRGDEIVDDTCGGAAGESDRIIF